MFSFQIWILVGMHLAAMEGRALTYMALTNASVQKDFGEETVNLVRASIYLLGGHIPRVPLGGGSPFLETTLRSQRVSKLGGWVALSTSYNKFIFVKRSLPRIPLGWVCVSPSGWGWFWRPCVAEVSNLADYREKLGECLESNNINEIIASAANSVIELKVLAIISYFKFYFFPLADIFAYLETLPMF